MVNKQQQQQQQLNGRWLSLFTKRCNLRPMLGTYRVAQQDQQRRVRVPDLEDANFRNRDLFTRTVRSSALPRKGIPDIDCLRRRPAIKPHCGSLRASQDSSILPTTEYRRHSSIVHQLECERKNAVLRQMEQRIMRSTAHYYSTMIKQSICVASVDGITRKYISEALDDQHKESLAKFRTPSDKTLDMNSKHSLFLEWKNSAISAMEQQAEEDLKMVADYQRIIRESKPAKKKRLTLVAGRRAKDGEKQSVRSDSSFNDSTQSLVSSFEHYQQESARRKKKISSTKSSRLSRLLGSDASENAGHDHGV